MKNPLRVRGFCIALASTGAAMVSGCDSYRDVTHDTAYGDFAAVRGAWRTKVPLKIVRIDELDCLVVVNYTQAAELAAVPTGSRIRIDNLILKETIETTQLRMMGTVLSGDYAGKPLYVDRNIFLVEDLLKFESRPGQSGVTNKPWSISPDVLER